MTTRCTKCGKVIRSSWKIRNIINQYGQHICEKCPILTEDGLCLVGTSIDLDRKPGPKKKEIK